MIRLVLAIVNFYYIVQFTFRVFRRCRHTNNTFIGCDILARDNSYYSCADKQQKALP